MKKVTRILAVLFALSLVLVMAACGTSAPSGDTATAPIKIGIFQDVTGPTSSSGLMVEAGVKWAVEEINAAGGINGVLVETITYDTKGNVDEAIAAYNRAVTVDNVSALVGPPVANIALAIGPMTEENDIPFVGLGIDPKCQVKEDGTPYKNMFCMQPSSIQMGTIMAKFALKNDMTSIGIIYNEANAYSVTLRTAFSETAVAGGAEIVEDVPFTANDRDFKTLLAGMIDKNVDVIFAPNYPQELILIVQQARALGYEGKIIAAVDGSPPFADLLGEDCDDLYYINNYDQAAVAAMEAEIKEKLNIVATNKFYLGYDIANVLCMFFAEVGNDPAAVSAKMETLSNYPGLTGNITINPATHMPTGLAMYIYTYEGTTPVLVDHFAAEE